MKALTNEEATSVFRKAAQAVVRSHYAHRAVVRYSGDFQECIEKMADSLSQKPVELSPAALTFIASEMDEWVSNLSPDGENSSSFSETELEYISELQKAFVSTEEQAKKGLFVYMNTLDKYEHSGQKIAQDLRVVHLD